MYSAERFFAGVSVTLYQTRKLQTFGNPDTPDLIAKGIIAFFEQQGHNKETDKSPGSFNFLQLPDSQRLKMRGHQVVKRFTGGRIRKNQLSHRTAVK